MGSGFCGSLIWRFFVVNNKMRPPRLVKLTGQEGPISPRDKLSPLILCTPRLLEVPFNGQELAKGPVDILQELGCDVRIGI